MIRSKDFKEYGAYRVTVDDLFPVLPVPVSQISKSLFYELQQLSSNPSGWKTAFNFQSLDRQFALKYGDRYLGILGAQGLKWDSTNKEFSDPDASTILYLAEMIDDKYDQKWTKIWAMMTTSYKPLDNWDGKETRDLEHRRTGTKGLDNETRFLGEEDKTKVHEIDSQNPHSTVTTFQDEATTRSYTGAKDITRYTDTTAGIDGETTTRQYGADSSPYKETKQGGTVHTPVGSSTQRTYSGLTETDTTLESGGTVSETMVAGFNSDTTGTHPATVTTGASGGQSVSGSGYVPSELRKDTTSDGKKKKETSGGYTDATTFTGTETTVAQANTYDGIEGKIADKTTGGHSVEHTGSIADTVSGGHTVTETGKWTDTTTMTYVGRKNEFDGTTTYNLTDADDGDVTYSGFMDRTGRGTRQLLAEQEWEFRKHNFLEMMFTDIINMIALKTY